MPPSLTARERAMADVLDGSRRFQVPPYQRPYAWGEEEALELLADLRTAIDQTARLKDAAPPYFLGSIVLVKSTGERAEQIVDGHQRLTTATILLAVLRDLDVEAGPALDMHIRAPARFASGHAQKLLVVRPLDAEFFHRAVQQPGATVALEPDTPVENDAQANMLAVALAYRSALASDGDGARRWLAEYLLRRCYVVEVSAPYQEQAFQIFTVLNKRGKDLSDADILKGDVIAAVAPHLRNHYAMVWERLEAELGVAAFEQLFGHLRMIHTQKRARGAIAFEVREILRPAAAPERFIDQELGPKGRVLRALSAADLRAGAQTVDANRLLTALGRVRNKDWLPPAIVFFADRKPNGEASLAFLKALDRLAYALLLQGADEPQRIARYAPAIKAAREGAPVEELCARLALSPHEKETARSVLNGAIYQKERARLPVLLRIDEHLSERVARYAAGRVSVEHVMPQNPPPQSEWVQLWPDAKLRKRWTDRLGNLTLLSREKNNDARNDDFETKKRAYFTKNGVTPFVLATQLLLETEWTPEVVKRRHEQMLRAACEIWDLV